MGAVRWLMPFFSGSRKFWVGAAVCTFISSALEPVVPALLKPLLDEGFRPGSSLQIWMVPLALMLLFAVRGVAGFLADLALARIAQVPFRRGDHLGGLPGMLGHWTEFRDLPAVPQESFRQWWERREKGGAR